jgi:1,4-dihydroxy-2-naphthoate octaprenyltransferase
MRSLSLFIRLSRPLFVIGVMLIYALGVGIAHYLGVVIDWGVYILGQAWVSLLQLSAQYLNEYFNAPADEVNPNRTILTGGSGALGEGKLPRRVALMASFTCLTFLASITVVMIAQVEPPMASYLIMGLAFLGALFYSTPPLKLEASGYGELIVSVIVALMVPAFSYNLQAGELSVLIPMSTFPMTALHLAMLLAFELPDYTTDIKTGKQTLLVRLGWQQGMTLHNILILSAFLLVGLAGIFGYPTFALVAGLIPLPLGFIQILQMRNIRRGVKPNWNALTIGALALFTAMAYFTAFSFWTN